MVDKDIEWVIINVAKMVYDNNLTRVQKIKVGRNAKYRQKVTKIYKKIKNCFLELLILVTLVILGFDFCCLG